MSAWSDLIGTLRSTFTIGRKVTLSTASVTAPRTLTLPDKDGTAAMLDDIRQEVFATATPPTIAYPAINFQPVSGYSGLYVQQVNA